MAVIHDQMGTDYASENIARHPIFARLTRHTDCAIPMRTSLDQPVSIATINRSLAYTPTGSLQVIHCNIC
jgi:hypothetical protein